MKRWIAWCEICHVEKEVKGRGLYIHVEIE